MGKKKAVGAAAAPPQVETDIPPVESGKLTAKQKDKQGNLAKTVRTADPLSVKAKAVVMTLLVLLPNGATQVVRYTAGKWHRIAGERSLPYCISRLTKKAANNGGMFSTHADRLGSSIGVLVLYFKARRRLSHNPLTKDGAIQLGNVLKKCLRMPDAFVDECIEDDALRYGRLSWKKSDGGDGRYDAFNEKAVKDAPVSLTKSFGEMTFDPDWVKNNAPDWCDDFEGDSIDEWLDLLDDKHSFDSTYTGDGSADEDDNDDHY